MLKSDLALLYRANSLPIDFMVFLTTEYSFCMATRNQMQDKKAPSCHFLSSPTLFLSSAYDLSFSASPQTAPTCTELNLWYLYPPGCEWGHFSEALLITGHTLHFMVSWVLSSFVFVETCVIGSSREVNGSSLMRK